MNPSTLQDQAHKVIMGSFDRYQECLKWAAQLDTMRSDFERLNARVKLEETVRAAIAYVSAVSAGVFEPEDDPPPRRKKPAKRKRRRTTPPLPRKK